jgi:predicted hydrolase (HD superfamily)
MLEYTETEPTVKQIIEAQSITPGMYCFDLYNQDYDYLVVGVSHDLDDTYTITTLQNQSVQSHILFRHDNIYILGNMW